MKSIDEFVKQNNSSSSKFKDIHDFIGKPQVDSYFQSEQQFNPMVQNPSMPFVAPHSPAVSANPADSPVMKDIHEFMKNQPDPVHENSGWKGILDNPITRFAKTIDKNVTAFQDAGANSLTFGLNNKLAQYLGEQQSIDNQHSIAGKVGEITGDLVGISKLYKGGAALTKALLPNAGKIAKLIAPGLVAGAGYQGINEATDAAFDTRNDGSQSIGKRALNVGESAAQFAGGDVALRYAGQGIKALADKTGLSSKLSQSFDNMFRKVKPIDSAPITQTGPVLGLPEPKSAIMAREAQNRSVLPANIDVIHGQGDVQTLGLPEGNYTQPTRLKVNNPTETLDYVMTKIKPQVMSIIEAPARRDLLVQYVQKNMQIPVDEIHNMPIKQLQDLGQNIQKDLHGNMQQIAFDVAKQQGHDLPALLENQAPNLRAQLAKDSQSQVYGVQPPKIDIQKPNFNVTHNADAAMPITKIGRPSSLREVAATTEVKPKVDTINGNVSKNETIQPRTALPDIKIKGQQLKDLRTGDETGFANTVKNSEYTAPELKKAITEEPIIVARTTDVLNRQEANKIINKHGLEGTHDILMAKTKQFSAVENTAAQIVAKHLSSLGGEDNLKKAINLVSKTAKGGREMGQAIQALSQWNKLDETGALMIGERQLNKGVSNTEDWKSLSVAQGKPITEAAQRIVQAQDTKNLADEVLSIVTNKAQGESLTEAEKATIKQFQDQVKLINEKGKGILSKPKAEKVNKVNETIKKVSQIEPKARTRDQVVSFLDAKAEKARQRLAASRNIGFAAVNKGNPVMDYAIIGASHIAKGIVKLSDFTEAMVRDFGESVKPHINEAFTRATNIFRKENGLPTVEQLDKAVRTAVKDERFTPEQAEQFKAWASEIGYYADKNLKVEATQDLQKALNDIGTSTFGDKLSATQTAAQLLNPTTLARNVIGNEAFNLVEKTNKLASVPIDWALSKITGERTVVFAKNQEKYWDNFVKGFMGGWKGVSPNGQFEAMDIHPNAFKSDKNPLKYLQKALGAELQSFDHAAYMRAYGRTLGEYAKITGKKVEDLDEAIFDLADEAGRYATFQDDTFLSKLATGTKRLLNKPTDLLADALVHKGVLPESLSWKGFGTGDLILKYAKTPANIVMRGIDYSPIGFMRGLGELIPLISGKTFNQRVATMALSRGITGSLGMTAMGYALISSGILTGKSSSDADIRSLDLQTGKGEYKVNWSALERYIKCGLDKNAAQWKEGDKIFDWGWLQPMAISISMGVNAQQSVEKQKTEGTSSYVVVAKDALIGSLKTIMQQPLLSGVQNLVSGVTNVMRYGSWTGIANIFKGLPASFVPSALNQVRNLTDNTTRNTYDPSALKEALNMIVNKIPGLDKNLPVAYDTLGGQREQIQGGQPNTLAQATKSFLSPVKMTNYTVSPEAKMVMDLINSTGNETVAPRTPNKYLMVNKKKVELTPDQYSEIQQKTGEATQQALSKLSARLANPNLADDAKVKLVVDTLNIVGTKVRTQLNKEYPELKPLTAYQLKHTTK